MPRNRIAIISPARLGSDLDPGLEQYAWRFLAEGDSWFTVGTLNPLENSNLLEQLSFEQSACAVTCARPGDELQRMIDYRNDRDFHELLFGARARRWDALLLSAGGNDLIAALDVGPEQPDPSKRLLCSAAEWDLGRPAAERYISNQGWSRFLSYITANLAYFVELRDRPGSLSVGQPILLHTYAIPTIRRSGALGGDGWLWPVVKRYGIPESDWDALSTGLVGRFAKDLVRLAGDPRLPNLHVFDSAHEVALEPALPGSRDESGDWANEIHLRRRGYKKVAAGWSDHITAALRR